MTRNVAALALGLAVLGLAGPGSAQFTTSDPIADRCQFDRSRAVSKKAKIQCGCVRKALITSQPIDTLCLAKGTDKFNALLVKAEEKAIRKGGMCPYADASLLCAPVSNDLLGCCGNLRLGLECR